MPTLPTLPALPTLDKPNDLFGGSGFGDFGGGNGGFGFDPGGIGAGGFLPVGGGTPGTPGTGGINIYMPPLGGSTGGSGATGGTGATLIGTGSSSCAWYNLLCIAESQLLRLVLLILGIVAIIGAIYLYKPTSEIIAAPIRAAKETVKAGVTAATIAA